MNNFTLLKRTFTVSKFDRYCDGYHYIINNSTKEDRLSWGIDDDDHLQKIIKEGEKYIYEVGIEDGVFKTMSISFDNYAIIKKHINLYD